MARKPAAKPAAKPAVEEKKEEVKEIIEEEVKMVSFIFQPENTASQGHEIKNYNVRVDGLGIKTRTPIVQSLPKRVKMEVGDVLTIPEQDFKILAAKGYIRSKAVMALRQELIDNKIPLYEMSDAERNLIITELPYEL